MAAGHTQVARRRITAETKLLQVIEEWRLDAVGISRSSLSLRAGVEEGILVGLHFAWALSYCLLYVRMHVDGDLFPQKLLFQLNLSLFFFCGPSGLVKGVVHAISHLVVAFDVVHLELGRDSLTNQVSQLVGVIKNRVTPTRSMLVCRVNHNRHDAGLLLLLVLILLLLMLLRLHLLRGTAIRVENVSCLLLVLIALGSLLVG